MIPAFLLLVLSQQTIAVEAEFQLTELVSTGMPPSYCEPREGEPSVGDLVQLRTTVRSFSPDQHELDGMAVITFPGTSSPALWPISHAPEHGEWLVTGTSLEQLEHLQVLPERTVIGFRRPWIGDPSNFPFCVFDASIVTWIDSLLPGDANRDGRFDSRDLVEVFIAGKYETTESADWTEGDWNGDNRFSSRDLTLALQAGEYQSDLAAMAVPEPAAAVLAMIGLAGVISRRRRAW
jgi:hypothetical protein